MLRTTPRRSFLLTGKALPAIVIAGVLFCLSLLTSSDVLAQSFAVSDFRDTAGFVYVNIPTPQQVLELTRDGWLRPTVGAIWRRERVPIGGSWTATVAFSISDTGGAPDPSGRGGADGLALVLQLEGPEAIGSTGYGLGYHGIKGGLAVEVDTWDDSAEPIWNGATEDVADHVAIMSNRRDPISAVPMYSEVNLSRVLPSAVDDGMIHTLAVRYTPGRLAVYLDDCRTPVAELPIWLDQALAPTAWIGITAATQSAWQHHRIHSFCFTASGLGCGCPLPCDTLYLPSPPDSVVVRDTIAVRDTVWRDRWRDHFDTVWIALPPDTVTVERWRYDTTVITRVDTLWRRDTAFFRDTLVVVRVDTVRLVVRDSVRPTDTLYVMRDTCIGLVPDDSICGYQQRAFTYQDSVALAVRPVPASDALTFLISSPGPWLLSVHDPRGRLVCSHSGNASVALDHDVGDLAPGMYFARLVSGDVVRVVRMEIRR